MAGSMLLKTLSALRRNWSESAWRLDRAAEPDVLDNAFAMFGSGQGINAYSNTSHVSPRRHPWLFTIIISVSFGLLFSIWHTVVEGPWATMQAAALFGALAAIGPLTGFALFNRYLHLIRPIPKQR